MPTTRVRVRVSVGYEARARLGRAFGPTRAAHEATVHAEARAGMEYRAPPSGRILSILPLVLYSLEL